MLPMETPLTRGDRAAERMASLIGSWRFLGTQTAVLLGWLFLNTAVVALAWDHYPYILLNLCLSFQAAYTGPILLIASNVSARRDRAQIDRIERLSEKIEHVVERLEQIEQRLATRDDMIAAMHTLVASHLSTRGDPLAADATTVADTHAHLQ